MHQQSKELTTHFSEIKKNYQSWVVMRCGSTMMIFFGKISVCGTPKTQIIAKNITGVYQNIAEALRRDYPKEMEEINLPEVFTEGKGYQLSAESRYPLPWLMHWFSHGSGMMISFFQCFFQQIKYSGHDTIGIAFIVHSTDLCSAV